MIDQDTDIRTTTLIVEQKCRTVHEPNLAFRPFNATRSHIHAGQRYSLSAVQNIGNLFELFLLVTAARQLPETQPQQRKLHKHSQQQKEKFGFQADAPFFADNDKPKLLPVNAMEKLLIIAFIILIIWNLGAGLYYMMVDKGKTDRTVKSLSWRIGLSVLLILLVIAGIFTGIIKPHGIP